MKSRTKMRTDVHRLSQPEGAQMSSHSSTCHPRFSDALSMICWKMKTFKLKTTIKINNVLSKLKLRISMITQKGNHLHNLEVVRQKRGYLVVARETTHNESNISRPMLSFCDSFNSNFKLWFPTFNICFSFSFFSIFSLQICPQEFHQL